MKKIELRARIRTHGWHKPVASFSAARGQYEPNGQASKTNVKCHKISQSLKRAFSTDITNDSQILLVLHIRHHAASNLT